MSVLPRSVLPSRFRFAQKYSEGLHDRLIDILRNLQNERFWELEFDFRSTADAKAFAATADGDVRQWLEENGYGDVLGELLLIPLVYELIEDFAQFVYEALSSCAAGRTVVTWALLRKPVTDVLSHLEWIVADPEEFLTAFYNLTPNEFEGRARARELARARIQKVMSVLPSGAIFDADFLYDLRYGSSEFEGVARIANRALHLVTRRYDDTPRSINLIFSGHEAREEDWNTLYSWIPQILFYAVEVCELAVSYASKEISPDFGVALLRRGVGFVLWGVARKRFHGDLPPRSEKMIDVDVDLRCTNCGSMYQNELQLERLYFGRSVGCRNCGTRHQLSDFLTTAEVSF